MNSDSTQKVLEHLSKLNVGNGRELSPEDTPTSLDIDMQKWLDGTLESSAFVSAGNLRLYTKLLVSNAAAGSIIGKAGSNINEFQAKTFSRIQLSKSGDYYPGTAERTLLVSGRLKQIIAALDLIFTKLQREGVAPVTPRSRNILESRISEEDVPHTNLAMKLLVPQPLCGIIIGRGGTTVRTYSADTATQIKVTAPEGHAPPLNHRVVTINGSQEGVLKAIALLTLKQAEDPKFPMYSELPNTYVAVPVGMQIPIGGATAVVPQSPHAQMATGHAMHAMQHHHHHHQQQQQAQHGGYSTSPYPTTPGSVTPGGSSGGGGGGIAVSGAPGYQAMYSNGGGGGHDGGVAAMSFALPDEHAALLVGRGGSGLEDLQATANVHIRIEMGGESGVVSGGGGGGGSGHGQPGMAQVIMTGSPDCLQFANHLMTQRLASAVMMHQQHYFGQANGTTFYQPYRMTTYGTSTGMPSHHHVYGSHAMDNDSHTLTTTASTNSTRRTSPRTVVAPSPPSHSSYRRGGGGGERFS